jgi:peptidyl-tRNA hydrolase
VISRIDLPIGVQGLQSGHAAIDFQHEHPEVAKDWNQNSNYLIFLSAKDESHLEQLLQKAEFKGLRTTSFREPDLDNQLTAIALEPSPTTKRLVSSLPLFGKEVLLCV